MRNQFLTIVILVLAFILTSCATAPEDVQSKIPSTENEEPLLFPEQEYTEIGEAFAKGLMINIKPANAGIPEDNIFANDESLVSYDYVTLFGVKGNIAFYLQDEKSTSCVFGSEPYESIADYKAALKTVNIAVAEMLGADIRELAFSGGDEIEDDWEQLFDGHGAFVSTYEANGYSLNIRGIGVGGAATVVVECHNAGSEG